LKKLIKQPRPKLVISVRKFKKGLLLITGAGLLGILTTLQYGGAGGLAGDAARMTAKLTAPVYIPYLTVLFELAGVILAVLVFYRNPSKKSILARLAVLGLYLVVIVLFVGSRSFVAPMMVGVVLSFNYYRSRIRLTGVGGLIMVGFLVVSVWYSYRRMLEYSWHYYLYSIVAAKGIDPRFALVTAPFMQIREAGVLFSQLVDYFPAQIPFWQGKVFFSHVLTLLPGKQWLVDDWITVFIRNRDPASIGGTPPTLLGGFYMDFGYAGVIMGMFFLGLLIQSYYRITMNDPTPIRMIFYCYLLSFAIVSLYGFFYLSLILIWKLIVLSIIWKYAVSQKDTYVPSSVRDMPPVSPSASH
jgi:hypothetical protein